MLVTWLGHTQVFLNVAGKTVLVDPWFAEPIHETWVRYPPAPYPTASTLPRPDFLVLSSADDDCASQATLAQMARGVSVCAPAATAPVLEQRLSRLGFPRVQWIKRSTELAPGLTVTFCAQHGLIFEGDGARISIGEVEAGRPLDLAFLSYTAATKEEGLRHFSEEIRRLAPREATPFGAGWAVLEPSAIENHFVTRATLDEALVSAAKVAAEAGTHLLRMEPGDEWSPETGVVRKELVAAWPQTREALQRYRPRDL